MQERRIYKVSEVTLSIKTLLEDNIGMIWVEGELSNYNKHSSGHMYFSLKDEAGILPCAFFRGSNRDLKFELKDGMHLICFGKVSIYEKKGDYQLIVEKVEPKGVGAEALRLAQLKEKLKKEGFFDPARKKALPFLPNRIGVVTSPTGAAVRDIINITKRRFPNVEIIINPVRVQGAGAGAEIAEAITLFNNLGLVDVMIVGRGGGSQEDLWAFNDEAVARAIFSSKIPIISAVGHEVDWTIADLVADFRAPTPSAAAELALPEKEKLNREITTLAERLRNALEHLYTRYTQEIDDLVSDIIKGIEGLVDYRSQEFGSLAGKLGVLSPLAVLERGYSITFSGKTEKVIKDTGTVKKGDTVKTKLAKGKIISRVEDIEP